MTTILRRVINGKMSNCSDISSDDWDLDVQISVCEKWLQENEIPPGDGQLVLDIGFQKRRDVAVPGYTVSCAFMKLLCERDIYLWLSLYPGECEK